MDESLKSRFSEFRFHYGGENAVPLCINNVQIPEEYLIFLKQYNGGEGSVGENTCLELWRYEELEEQNNAYHTEEFLMDSCLIGSDLSGEMFGIDKYGNYFAVPDIPMMEEEKIILGTSFKEFIERVDDNYIK